MQIYAVNPCRLPADRRSGKIDLCGVFAKRAGDSFTSHDQFAAIGGVEVAGSFNSPLISATRLSSMSSP